MRRYRLGMQLKPAPTPRPQPTLHPKPPTPNPHPKPPPQTPTPYSYPNPAPSPHPLQLAIQWLIIPFMNPPFTQFTIDKLEVMSTIYKLANIIFHPRSTAQHSKVDVQFMCNPISLVAQRMACFVFAGCSCATTKLKVSVAATTCMHTFNSVRLVTFKETALVAA